MHSFQIVGIGHEPFEHLFNLTDEQLKAVGDELLLLPYEHHPSASPYRSAGPIFIRRGATQQRLPAGHVPGYVTRRVISLRAYDTQGMMVDAAVCEGSAVQTGIVRCFNDNQVAYLQLHNAMRGCFSCQVNRS